MARQGRGPDNPSDRSLRSLLDDKASMCRAVIREEGGAQWEAVILQELRARLSRADGTGVVRASSGGGRLAYLVTVCRNVTRTTLACETGLFQRAVGGDRRAAEQLLMLFWRDIEKTIARCRASELDAEVVGRVARGFVKAVTGERTKLRVKSPEMLPKLVRVVCTRVIATVLKNHGLSGEHAVKFVPLEERQAGAVDCGCAEGPGEGPVVTDLQGRSKGDGLDGTPDQESAAAVADRVLGLLDGYVPAGGLVLRRELCAILERMPENHREAVLLRAYLPDWSIAELCQEFLGDMKPALFRTWLKRGRDHLRARIEERLRTIIPEEVADPVEARELRRLCRALGIGVQSVA